MKQVRIEERAVRRLSGVRVAAGNLWLRARVEGAVATPSAQLWVGDEAPVRVWAGDLLQVSGSSWSVVEIGLGPRTTGHVLVEEVPSS